MLTEETIKALADKHAKEKVERFRGNIALTYQTAKEMRKLSFIEGYKAALQTHYHIADNSDGFRDWLEKKGIFYLRNGHFTSIKLEGNDIFQLGVEFGLYRSMLVAMALETK